MGAGGGRQFSFFPGTVLGFPCPGPRAPGAARSWHLGSPQGPRRLDPGPTPAPPGAPSRGCGRAAGSWGRARLRLGSELPRAGRERGGRRAAPEQKARGWHRPPRSSPGTRARGAGGGPEGTPEGRNAAGGAPGLDAATGGPRRALGLRSGRYGPASAAYSACRAAERGSRGDSAERAGPASK